MNSFECSEHNGLYEPFLTFAIEKIFTQTRLDWHTETRQLRLADHGGHRDTQPVTEVTSDSVVRSEEDRYVDIVRR